MKTMKISEKLHKKLMELGKKGESFDKIITKLVEQNENTDNN